MKKLYKKFNDKSFQIFTIFTLLLLDLVNATVLFNRLNNYEGFKTILNAYLVELYSEGVEQLPADYLENFFQMLLQASLIMICSYITFHLIIYFFYFKRSAFCYFYLRVLTWSAGIITFVLASLNLILQFKFDFYLLLSPIYLYLAIGLGFFPIKKKTE